MSDRVTSSRAARAVIENYIRGSRDGDAALLRSIETGYSKFPRLGFAHNRRSSAPLARTLSPSLKTCR